ncbi:MAG: YkgJ family cysteine cluster protein [Thermodesulfobacteriota bacterium]|nr:YkgJ family cysteine cluster protein [Thermodesulfobacteriota bacterium]
MSACKDDQLKTSCNRCGSCCKQGGPALHTQDLNLVFSGTLHFEDLITVRRGELALQPLTDSLEPVIEEFIKLKGQGTDWCCRFFDHHAAACTIYAHRPLACGLLDCTHPDELLAIAGRDLLSRFELLAADDPLLPLVKLHEEHCPCPQLSKLTDRLAADEEDTLEQLTRQVNLDLAVRSKAAREFSLSVDRELFYFGRPLFQLMQPLGFTFTETVQGLILHYRSR